MARTKKTKNTKSIAQIKLSKDVKVTGLSAGIAKYYQIDPILFRVGFVALIILTGVIPGLIVYASIYGLVKNTSR